MRKTIKNIIYVLAGVLFAFNITSASALTEQSEVDVQFTFNPFLTMTLSSADIIIPNLAPGTSANSNTVNIVVNTNNISGYNLSATVGNTTKDTRNLVHTNGTNTFSSIDVGTSATTLTTDNTWGYSIDAGSHYSGLPIYSATNGAELKNTTAPAADDTTAFLIGAKAATSQVAGDYTNVINFVAVTNALPEPVHTIADGGNMQDVSSAAEGGCPSTLPEGQVYTLTDNRGTNPETYKVARLADGKCWMVENLNLAGGTALSADDTDVTSEYISGFTTSNNLTKTGNTIVLPASTIDSGFENDNYSYVANSGNKSSNCSTSPGCYSYYSWDAATLGSGRSIATDNTDAPHSICPKGWKLPNTRTSTDSSSDFKVLMIGYGGSESTSKYNTETNPTGATMYNNIGSGTTPNFLLAGYYYYGGSFYEGGSVGRYWSATVYPFAFAHELYFDSSYVSSANGDDQFIGSSVRCLLR